MYHLVLIFITVFLAELGDKTQLATLMLSSEGKHHPLAVFAAASAALVLSTGLAVILGTVAHQFLDRFPVKLIAGLGFMVIGAWSIYDHFSAH